MSTLAEREADLRAQIAALRARPDADRPGIQDNVLTLEDELAYVADQRTERIVHHVPRREVTYFAPHPAGVFAAVPGVHRSEMVRAPSPSISVRRTLAQRIRRVAGRARVQDDYELLLDGERVRGVWGTRREVMRQAHQALVLGVVPPPFLPDHLRLRGLGRRRALHQLRRHRRWKSRLSKALRENDRRHKVVVYRTIADDGSVFEFVRDAPGVRRPW